jgi:transposase
LVLQFVEGLSDRQAADAVRASIDWKYALGLELTDTGFDALVLSEFRARLLTHDQTERLLERLLERLRQHGLLAGVGGSAPIPPAWSRRYASSTGWSW